MRGLGPRIHVFLPFGSCQRRGWPGQGPAMKGAVNSLEKPNNLRVLRPALYIDVRLAMDPT
jgi:hypothetical protein